MVAIIVVISIMNGLQGGYLVDIQELKTYHVRLVPHSSDVSLLESTVMEIEDLPGVRYVERFDEITALLRTEDGSTYPCLIKGISPDTILNDEGFAERLNMFYGSLDPIAETDTIVIPYGIYSDIPYGLRVIELMTMAKGRTIPFVPVATPMRIVGAFESGFPDIDHGLCLVSYDLMRKIHPDDPGMIGIKLEDPFDHRTFSVLNSRFSGDFDVIDWREQIRPLYAALMLEKRSMQILLFLIFIVISVNIKHSLDRLIFVKRGEIGIMYAGGVSKSMIISVFFVQNLYLTGVGLIFGTVLGYLSSYYVNDIFRFGIDLVQTITRSPGRFRLIHIPVEILHHETLMVSVGVIALTFFATGLAVMRILRMNPLEILRYE